MNDNALTPAGLADLALKLNFKLKLASPNFRDTVPMKALLEPEVIWRLRVVITGLSDGVLTIVTDDPTALDTIDTLYHVLGGVKKVEVLTAVTSELEIVMKTHFASGESKGRTLRGARKHAAMRGKDID